MEIPSVQDLAFLGQQFEKHSPRLLRFVQGRLDERLTRVVGCQEILQSAFVRAQEKWQKANRQLPIDSYVWWYGIVRDCSIDTYRHHAGDKRDFHRNIPLPANSSIQLADVFRTDSLETPSRQLIQQETRDLVHNAVEKLSEQDQEILWMKHKDSLTHREIAEILKVGEEAAAKRYSRALVKVGKFFKEDNRNQGGR